MTTARRALQAAGRACAGGVLTASGLPSLPALRLSPDHSARYEAVTADLTAGRSADPAALGDRLDYLRWLATARPVLFHGSQHGDLATLLPRRQSSDPSAFGAQRAVFASSDPLWAMWFALLRRDGLRATSNGTWSAATLDSARYLFALDTSAPLGEAPGPGRVYVVARDGFVREPRIARCITTSQWARQEPVTPLFSLAVRPEDFPLRDLVVRFRLGERMPTTLIRARRAARRARR